MFLRAFKYLWPERFLPEPEQADPFEEQTTGPGKTGVLLVNLGTPQAPTAREIRRYLAEFLSDPRVIEIPRYLWWPILHGLVLTLRPKKLVPRYQGIWMDEGSPLMVYSRRQAQGVSRALSARGVHVEVELGMRYGQPSVAEAVTALRRRGCERILVMPLYPQYAASTTATAVDAVAAYAARLRDQPELRFVKRFHDDGGYLAAVVGRIERYWAEHGRPQKLVMSFHGLPRYSVELGDPYYQDCLRTGRLLRERLGLMPEQAAVTFQSRFGTARWLEPYTAPTLIQLAQEGVTEIDVVCPGFVADCLETLEEIQVECRDAFIAAGGRRLRYIPAVNDDETWIAALAELVQRNLQGWPVQG
ncbi:ferrochelatase [Bordetella genomosp. 9]|uniref:Ferrochelatase n=1 Tax=Bordetella genomosp. 9 TaxID=1416803 RepID=A0A1W6Z2Z2_9BORD|nr:ferrochelatase [Bordetella genomosp. 9]ARP87621.1 ferrochelatase [Bordetella genomosp. 9]ARP91592.1 ferrochelatase [Bordetella genomosp. 9]